MRDVALLVMGVILIVFRMWWIADKTPTYRTGQRVRVIGRIAIEPQTTSWKQTITVGNFLIDVPLWPIYQAGERVEVTGVVKVSASSQNRYLLPLLGTLQSAGSSVARGEIKVKADEIRIIDETGGLVGMIMGIRRKADEIMKRVLPEPQAGLLSGIVWGGRQGLPSEFVKALKRTSTMHVVAASGMNVTLVAQFFISSLLVLLTRRKAIVVGLLGILAYIVAAGGMNQPSVIRAGIMAAALLTAQFFGRQYDRLRLLIGTGMVMLILNPFWMFEIGWQLSMAATAGLMVMGGGLGIISKGDPLSTQGVTLGRRLWRLIESDFRTSLAATLATLPIMVGNFGQLSLVAPLVNGLVLWVVAPLMVIGLLILPLGLIWLPLAQIMSWVGWVMLSYFIGVVEFFGKLPFSAIDGISFPWWLGVAYYAILFLVVLILRSGKLAEDRRKAIT